METHRNRQRRACPMGRARVQVYLVVLRNFEMNAADPLNRSCHRRDRQHRMPPNDRCYLNLRRCFVLAVMLSQDAFSIS